MRVVFTGGPNCGKTSMVNLLRERGYDIIEESAREIIKRRRENHGEVGNLESLQSEIAEHQLQKEKSYAEGRILFLDRSILDVYAYSKVLAGKVPERVLELGHNGVYDYVFLLDLLPFKNDGQRIENGDEDARILHEELGETYRSFGYSPIVVPVMENPEARLKHVLKILNLKGGVS